MSGLDNDSAGGGSAFSAKVIGALIVAGVIGFIGYWLLTAFAPELGGGRVGTGHALSRGATGFAGIVRLARENGIDVHVLRADSGGAPGADDSELGGLFIVTLPPTIDAEALDKRLRSVSGPKLIVLPKWQSRPHPLRRDWIGSGIPLTEPASGLPDWARAKSGTRLVALPAGSTTTVSLFNEPTFAMPLPRKLQLLAPGENTALITADGGVLLAESFRTETYILSDPDLLSNLAMRDPAHAAAALRLLTTIAGPGEPIGFDVTLNGIGTGRSLLRLVFTPPFLGMTLCLIVAALFAGWQSFVRFGPPWRDVRAIALGKAALVANTAQLIVQARRIPSFAARYGATVREAAARRLHAPSGLAGTGLDNWLDRFADSRGRTFSTLLADLESARSTPDIVARAAALGAWRKDVLRDYD